MQWRAEGSRLNPHPSSIHGVLNNTPGIVLCSPPERELNVHDPDPSGYAKRIQSIHWKRAHDAAPTDVTETIQEGTISATRHPDDNVAEPKDYTVTLTLDPDSAAFAEALEEALLDVQTSQVTDELVGVDEPVDNTPVSVSKGPYPRTNVLWS